MDNQSPNLGRPADKCNSIVSELRRRIVDGTFPPGSQMPRRTEIERDFQASTVTVQRALEQLREEGFVWVKGRQGTFVTDSPPHLSEFVLVMPGRRDERNKWGRFWTALVEEAERVERMTGRSMRVYYSVDRTEENRDYARLIADVKAHRVAALAFASFPHNLVGTPVLEEPGIPRVTLMGPGGVCAMPRVVTDVKSFFDLAVDYLAARGRRRVAFVCPVGHAHAVEECLGSLALRGMSTRPVWYQVFSPHAPFTARNVVNLLMDASRPNRPDALIISDDNLVEHATAGLLDARIQVPAELDVVAHCNFPYPTPSHVDACRIGFDARRVVQAFLDSLDGQLRHEEVPAITLIKARFAGEGDLSPT